MARSKKTKGGRKIPFVPVAWDLLNSRAYSELTGSAAKVLNVCLGKPKVFINDVRIYAVAWEFPYSEAERFGVAKRTFNRCLCELIERGFLDCRTKGGLRGHAKTASTFSLSPRWRKYGEPDFQKMSFENFFPGK